MATDSRLIGIMLAGNLGGGLLTFVYFRYLDPAAMQTAALPRGAEFAFFVVAFTVLFVVGWALAMSWLRPVLGAPGALSTEPAGAAVRRRALLVPAFFALLSFGGWVTAALVWGVAWPLATGRFALAAALRQGFGIIFVSGVMVAVFIFLSTERVWRERLPRFFPDGDLRAAGAPRLGVRTRLVVLFLLMSVLPMAVLAMATLVRANAVLGADVEFHDEMLHNLILVQAVLAGAGLLVALRLAGYVAGSVAEPLRHLQDAMARVEQGSLDARCRVVSNDEIGAVAEGFNRMVAGLRERDELREMFGKYVSPEVRDEILAGRAALGGDAREVTILFADLREFASWVESAPAAEVVAGLNAYFSEMDSAIRAHGGLVLQFIGDEIEAVFGAPVADPRHADRAVAAALDMQQRLVSWNEQRRAAGQHELRHGIGIHSGTVVAGNIGSSARMSYTLVGDAVNVASRIEALNKTFGTSVLVSSATRALLTQAHPLRALPAAQVKGRSAEVEVYALQ